MRKSAGEAKMQAGTFRTGIVKENAKGQTKKTKKDTQQETKRIVSYSEIQGQAFHSCFQESPE